MKIILPLILSSFINVVIINAQWQPDVRLTNNPAISYMASSWTVASSGNIVHVIWYDERNGNSEIYYKRSSDSGVTWGADTRLTNDAGISSYPTIAVSDSVVHIVWQDSRDGNYKVYYKRSINAGINWETDILLTNSAVNSYYPCISAFGNAVHIVWYDQRDGNREIYYKNSSNSGLNWSVDTRLTNNPSDSRNPAICISGLTLHVVWHDERDGNSEIYYKRSSNGGVNWSTDTRLTTNIAGSWNPSIAISGSVVHIGWSDSRDDNNSEIYYKRSTDGGITWETDKRFTNDPALSNCVSLASNGFTVHAAWYDTRIVNGEIYYKRSTDGGESWDNDLRLTNNSNVSLIPSVSISGPIVNIVWYENNNGNWDIYYKRNPTGNPIGINNISSEIPNEFKLEQNYPNPFNPDTKIKFSIPKSGFVNISVYNILGKKIESLVNENVNPGVYETEWNAVNYPSGVYYYKLSSGNFTETKKMILLK